MNTRSVKRLTAINYFGGKTRHLDWLLPYLNREVIPDLRECTHYVEPFCGAATVYLNQKPWPIETINDIDAELYNFFCVLRDKKTLQQLVDSLLLTPYSREEFMQSLKPVKNKVERARRFFVRQMQSFGGMGYSQTRLSSWRTQFKETRRGMSMEVSKILTKINGLQEVSARLTLCQIENRDFRHIMETHNKPYMLLYCDPPYVESTRSEKRAREYKYEMSDQDHLEFLYLANKTEAKVCISGFDSEMYSVQLPLVGDGGKWHQNYGPDRVVNIGKKRGVREVVWTNYNPKNQAKLFEDE